MNEHFSITDESPEHVWFSQLPNILRFIKLTPYQKAIYWELKAVAGDSGVCFKSVKSLAEACEMSERKVQETLKELCEINPIIKLPLLKKTCRTRPDGGSASSEYTITNIWPKNNEMYLSIISSGGAQCAGGRVHVVRGEGACGAPKEDTIKNNPYEKEPFQCPLPISILKDNVCNHVKNPKKSVDNGKKTLPFLKNKSRTLEGPEKFKLTDDQKGVYDWLTANCSDVDLGTRCFWAKTYTWDRIKQVFHESKSRNPDRLGAYMNKLFKLNASAPNAYVQECKEYATVFKQLKKWKDLKIGQKCVTFKIGQSTQDIDYYNSPEEFARTLQEKYEIYLNYKPLE